MSPEASASDDSRPHWIDANGTFVNLPPGASVAPDGTVIDSDGNPIKVRKKPGRKPNPLGPQLRKEQNRQAQRNFRQRQSRRLEELEAEVLELRMNERNLQSALQVQSNSIRAMEGQVDFYRELANELEQMVPREVKEAKISVANRFAKSGRHVNGRLLVKRNGFTPTSRIAAATHEQTAPTTPFNLSPALPYDTALEKATEQLEQLSLVMSSTKYPDGGPESEGPSPTQEVLLHQPHDPRIDFLPSRMIKVRFIEASPQCDLTSVFEYLLHNARCYGDPGIGKNWVLPDEFFQRFPAFLSAHLSWLSKHGADASVRFVPSTPDSQPQQIAAMGYASSEDPLSPDSASTFEPIPKDDLLQEMLGMTDDLNNQTMFQP